MIELVHRKQFLDLRRSLCCGCSGLRRSCAYVVDVVVVCGVVVPSVVDVASVVVV